MPGVLSGCLAVLGHHLRLVSILPSKQPQWRYRLHTAANHEDAGRGAVIHVFCFGYQAYDVIQG